MCIGRLPGAGKLGQADGLKLARLPLPATRPQRREYGMVGAVTQRTFPPEQSPALCVSRARQLPKDSPHPVKSLLCRHSQARPPTAGETLYPPEPNLTPFEIFATSRGPPPGPPLFVVPPHLT